MIIHARCKSNTGQSLCEAASFSDTQYVRRPVIRALLACVAAAAPLVGCERGPQQPRTALQRLTNSPRALFSSLLTDLQERTPQLGDLLGLPEPQAPAQDLAAQTPPEEPAVSTPLHRGKTPGELRIEGLIQAAFQEYFKEYTFGGRRLAVRIPFALNGEREGARGYVQDFYFDGKGTPDKLWPYIDSVLASKAFKKYAAQVGRPGEKVIVFTLRRRSYQVSTSQPQLEALKQDSYPGTPTRIFVLRNGDSVSEADIYNYLYAVAAVGVDCSGFAYHILESVARAYGLELDAALAQSLRTDPRSVRKLAGLAFFDPARGFTERVPDRIEELRPADLLLFRGSDGTFKHSAVIQSVDFQEGTIRYVQSTDWASEEERGVHLSTIHFDPARPGESLAHYSVRWLQQVRPPFAGENEPRNWQTDRDRYLWYTEAGGSTVARLRILAADLAAAEPGFYTTRTREGR